MILMVAGVVAGLVYAGIQYAVAAMPSGLGVKEGALAPCPASPNCVSTSASGAAHMPSLRFSGTVAEARTVLISALRELKIEIIHSDEQYIHGVAVTRWLRFKDDVEFLINPAARTIHFRSASRLGYSDLGTNRARLEKIARRLAAYGITAS